LSIEYSLIVTVWNAATAALLDVHVTAGVAPVVPSDIVTAAVNPVGSVCPASSIVDTGTEAFAGVIAIDATVAAVTVSAAGVAVGATPANVHVAGRVAVIAAAPAAAALNCPGVEVSVAGAAGFDVNTAIPVMSVFVPPEYVATAASCAVCPTAAVTTAGVTAIEAICAAVTVIVVLPSMIPDAAVIVTGP
jgi:hypothetical protein